ncbi:acyltransferase family protein [Lichenifustis flavocetrariae]|uniref:Acyltransferase family protein n=1 Tax=Lichenifustis flavocetrariae TaxID=2949735 RepID=A0AA41YZX9_9HYPH|nr:acyltransferase family protein [Lichenifustis flavocetrariae]MCW6507988.1 acyltransferase family protein [Lichenifustis flavocetrariae]
MEQAAISERKVTQDAARGIGIILVVYGHLQRGMLDLGLGAHFDLMRAADFVLYTTHMPLFFLLAGWNVYASIGKQGPHAFLRSRPATILWPYFFWSTIFVLAQQIASTTIAIHHSASLSAIPMEIFKPIGIFWFLYSLFIAQVVAVASSGRSVLLMTICLLADLMLFEIGPLAPVPVLTQTLLHLPFFAFGFMAAERQFKVPYWMRDTAFLAPTLCAAVGLALIASGLGASWPVSFATIPASCLGIVAIFLLAQAITRTKMGAGLAHIGQQSMGIYVLHIFTLPVFVRIARFASPEMDGLTLAIGTGFGVVASVMFCQLLKWSGLDGLLGLSRRPVPLGSLVSRFRQVQAR